MDGLCSTTPAPQDFHLRKAFQLHTQMRNSYRELARNENDNPEQ